MSSNSRTAVIIDDEKVILLGISAVLKRSGFETLTASSGADGLKLVQENIPDIIICDVNMPPPNGFEMRRILSEDQKTAEIPFIFVTARTSQSDKLLGLETGADDYITKPFDREELLARVQAVLRRAERAHQKGFQEGKSEMERLRTEIMNNVSHELRTPMGLLLNSLELAMRGRFESSEEEKEFVGRALSNAQQLRGLIEDLLLLTQIDQDKVNTFRQELDLQFDLFEPVRTCIDRYIEKNLDVHIDVDPATLVHAPRVEFRQAILHLADNACKFSPDKGRIDVSVKPNGDGGCIITFSDSGNGIPLENREQVFERYYQVSQGDTRQYRGLGVGLHIARTIARSLGGDVEILDGGHGCRIRMTIAPAPVDWIS